MTLQKMAWRNILRNKRRTAISATAIAIAAMTIVLLFSLVSGLQAEMKLNLQEYYFGEVRIRHSEYEKYEMFNPLHLSVQETSLLSEKLMETGLFTSASPRINFPAAIYEDGADNAVRATGMDFETDIMKPERFLVQGRLPEAGKREVLLGVSASRNLGYSVGDKFTALSSTLRRASNAFTFEVVGIANFPLNDVNAGIYVPVDQAQRMLKMGDRAIDMIIDVAPGVKLTEAREVIAGIVQADAINAGQLQVEAWNKIPSSYIFIRMAQLIYYIAGSVFYVLASTVIINTIMMIIFERTREIGTLASMGMEGEKIVHMFFLESVYISTIGSIAGAAIGILFTLILQETGIDLTSAMEGVDFEISGIMYPKLTAFNVIVAVISGIVVASGISLLPSKRAAQIKPVEAMKSV